MTFKDQLLRLKKKLYLRDEVNKDEEEFSPGPENVIIVRSTVSKYTGCPSVEQVRVPPCPGNTKHGTANAKNSIRTSQYRWWNFILLNLVQQCLLPANMYFLLMAALQLIPQISDSGGIPTFLMPLGFVFAVTMIKDGYEDIKRHRSDKEENTRKTLILNEYLGRFVETTWDSIKPGDIVRVLADEIFPADLLLLSCSDEMGVAYVETVQLDGETNMKTKTCVPAVSARCPDAQDIIGKSMEVLYGPPSSKLYSYNGMLRLYDEPYAFNPTDDADRACYEYGLKRSSIVRARSKMSGMALSPKDYVAPTFEANPVGITQFLWRGARLQNTLWVNGLVVYAGHETRIFKNTKPRTVKYSGLMRTYNRHAILLFAMQFVFCVLAALLSAVDVNSNQQHAWYLMPEMSKEYSGGVTGFMTAFATAFGRYLLLLSYFVPITLLIQLEIAHWFQGFYIHMDDEMYSKVTEKKAAISTVGIIEDLGNITHVFSDKTGTLTQNVMQLRCLTVGKRFFGLDDDIEEDETQPAENRPPKDEFIASQIKKLSKEYIDLPKIRLGSKSEATEIEKNELEYLSLFKQMPLPPTEDSTSIEQLYRLRPNRFVMFDAPAIRTALLTDPQTAARSTARQFIMILALCHSVLPKPGVVFPVIGQRTKIPFPENQIVLHRDDSGAHPGSSPIMHSGTSVHSGTFVQSGSSIGRSGTIAHSGTVAHSGTMSKIVRESLSPSSPSFSNGSSGGSPGLGVAGSRSDKSLPSNDQPTFAMTEEHSESPREALQSRLTSSIGTPVPSILNDMESDAEITVSSSNQVSDILKGVETGSESVTSKGSAETESHDQTTSAKMLPPSPTTASVSNAEDTSDRTSYSSTGESSSSASSSSGSMSKSSQQQSVSDSLSVSESGSTPVSASCQDLSMVQPSQAVVQTGSKSQSGTRSNNLLPSQPDSETSKPAVVCTDITPIRNNFDVIPRPAARVSANDNVIATGYTTAPQKEVSPPEYFSQDSSWDCNNLMSLCKPAASFSTPVKPKTTKATSVDVKRTRYQVPRKTPPLESNLLCCIATSSRTHREHPLAYGRVAREPVPKHSRRVVVSPPSVATKQSSNMDRRIVDDDSSSSMSYYPRMGGVFHPLSAWTGRYTSKYRPPESSDESRAARLSTRSASESYGRPDEELLAPTKSKQLETCANPSFAVPEIRSTRTSVSSSLLDYSSTESYPEVPKPEAAMADLRSLKISFEKSKATAGKEPAIIAEDFRQKLDESRYMFREDKTFGSSMPEDLESMSECAHRSMCSSDSSSSYILCGTANCGEQLVSGFETLSQHSFDSSNNSDNHVIQLCSDSDEPLTSLLLFEEDCLFAQEMPSRSDADSIVGNMAASENGASHDYSPGSIGFIGWRGDLHAAFDASSPDELALVAGAKHLGVEFLRRPDLNTIEVAVLNKNMEQLFLLNGDRTWVNANRDHAASNLPREVTSPEDGERCLGAVPTVTFEVLEVLDFDNVRKRMSVVIRDRDGSLVLLSKGADSSMLAIAAPGQSEQTQFLEESLNLCAAQGLRTLVLGCRTVSEAEYNTFAAKLNDARATGGDSGDQMGEIYSTIEKDLRLVGCTAIDDKLQDDVPATIEALKDAGIRVWVLTGDKVETAISIGHSCNLLTHQTFNAIVNGTTPEEVRQQLHEYMSFAIAGQLAKEAFEQIIYQQSLQSEWARGAEQRSVDGESSVVSRTEDDDGFSSRSRRCWGKITKYCYPSESRQQKRTKKKPGLNGSQPTMSADEFLRILTFNARHKKVVAPVDGQTQPKQLTESDVEALVKVYLDCFQQDAGNKNAGVLSSIPMLGRKKRPRVSHAPPPPRIVGFEDPHGLKAAPDRQDTESTRNLPVAVSQTDSLRIAPTVTTIKFSEDPIQQSRMPSNVESCAQDFGDFDDVSLLLSSDDTSNDYALSSRRSSKRSRLSERESSAMGSPISSLLSPWGTRVRRGTPSCSSSDGEDSTTSRGGILYQSIDTIELMDNSYVCADATYIPVAERVQRRQTVDGGSPPSTQQFTMSMKHLQAQVSGPSTHDVGLMSNDVDDLMVRGKSSSGSGSGSTAQSTLPPQMEAKVEQYNSVAITVTGEALHHALSTEGNRRYFFGLAHLCSTVIACRVTPKQKAEVVRQCARSTPTKNFVSLGIGDGANDVGMILTANVGVGIAGKEGMQAARSADVAFGEFKLLRNLLFCHGHTNLKRNGVMVYHTIFKNISFSMGDFFIGFFSGFSAADIYNSYLKQLYNLIYTPWPIMSLAVFDRFLPYEILLTCPPLYPVNVRPDGTLYSGTKWFTAWTTFAIVFSIVMIMFPIYSIANSSEFSGYKTAWDYPSFGQAIFYLNIIVSNFITIPFTHTVFWFTYLAFLICFVTWYGSWWILPMMVSTNIGVSLQSLNLAWSYHFIMILTSVLTCAVVFIWWRYKVMFHPTPQVIIRERIKKGVFDVIVAPRRRGELAVVVPKSYQKEGWKGFAFAPVETRFTLRRRTSSMLGVTPPSVPAQVASSTTLPTVHEN